MIDGIVLHHIVYELNERLLGGRIDKITQPEKDEIILQIRAGGKKHRLLLSSQASMPRAHLTATPRQNPASPPAFCMLLRKYVGNARITKIEQYGLERILAITLEQLDEMGDQHAYVLIMEIMGKHSNIMLCDQHKKVLDSIKRIGAQISSVRQVYPGSTYTAPPDQGKDSILQLDNVNTLHDALVRHKGPVYKSLYTAFTGMSPFYANHLCYVSDIHSDSDIDSLSDEALIRLFTSMQESKSRMLNNTYTPVLLRDKLGTIKEFHSLLLKDTLPEYTLEEYTSISELIDDFFDLRSLQVRMKQKTQDLRKHVQTLLERCYKKLDIQQHQLKDTENMERFKIKGELILAHQYMIQPGDSKVTVLNYYTNEEQTITLDSTLTAIENANKAFDKYNKKKRTKTAVIEQIEHTHSEINYLESVRYALESVILEEDIEEIRHELRESGYLKYKSAKKQRAKSKPYHYISSDGYHMYVGKNNLQNDYLSMKFAGNSDWWFHTKEVPGSHVVVKSEGNELPDRTFEEAAALAAYYSKARESTKVTVDYTQKKHLKKPSKAAPGYVIYHTNYSLHIDPSIQNIQKISG